MTATPRSAWSGIELRHLVALTAIAREGSFRGAAESLGYVQSAVSQQVAHLERIVGLRLVDRRRGASPVALTDAGSLLLHHTEQILARLAAARSDLGAIQSGPSDISVGIFDAIATRVIPRLLGEHAESSAEFRLRTVESRSSLDLARAVTAGDLDVAFGALPLERGAFEYRTLLVDPYVLLLPAAWNDGEAPSTPSPDELAKLPLIGPVRDGKVTVVEEALRGQGLDVNYVFHSDVDSAVQALVGAGVGAAIVPRLAVDASDPLTTTVDLDELVPPRVIALYWHRERKHAEVLDAFVSLTLAACAKIAAETSSPALAGRAAEEV